MHKFDKEIDFLSKLLRFVQDIDVPNKDVHLGFTAYFDSDINVAHKTTAPTVPGDLRLGFLKKHHVFPLCFVKKLYLCARKALDEIEKYF